MTNFELRRYFPAIDDLKAALVTPGTRHQADLEATLCYLYYMIQNYQAGLEHGNKALKLYPEQTFALRFRAWCLLNLERDEEALQDFTRVIELKPENPAPAYYDRQFAYYEMERFGEALADINKALALKPENREYVERKIMILNRMGRTEEAEKLVRTIIDDIGDDPVSLFNIANIFYSRNDPVTAKLYHDRALARYEALAQDDLAYKQRNRELKYKILISRGKALEQQEKYKAAQQDYGLASQVMPDDHLCWYYSGSLFTLRKNFRQAVNAYAECYARKPGYPNGWVNYGFAWSELKDLHKAIEVYDKALKLDNLPNRALILNNRGYSYLELGDPTQAKQDILASIQQNTDFVMGHISLGEYYLKMNQPQRAIDKFDEALGMELLNKREVLFGYMKRGMAYLEIDMPERAVLDFKEALEADADHIPTIEQLGRAYLESGEHCLAKQHLRDALVRDSRTEFKEAKQADELLARLFGENRNPCKESTASNKNP